MNFFEKIKKFNDMYNLPNNDQPFLLEIERLKNFKSILLEEVEEVDEIIYKYEDAKKSDLLLKPEDRVEVFTDLSDWLGDIIVYCASEARRWGLPTEEILDIIMESNFSKLGDDGKPIYDERGKVMKGPNYWKPEPKIRELIKDKE